MSDTRDEAKALANDAAKAAADAGKAAADTAAQLAAKTGRDDEQGGRRDIEIAHAHRHREVGRRDGREDGRERRGCDETSAYEKTAEVSAKAWDATVEATKAAGSSAAKMADSAAAASASATEQGAEVAGKAWDAPRTLRSRRRGGERAAARRG